MQITPTNTSSLTQNQAYNNVKISMLQKGVFSSFTFTGSNSDGSLNVSFVNADFTSGNMIMSSDSIIYQVN